MIAIIPTADRSKATVKVRIALDQKDPRILPEMGVRVSFLADRAGRTPKPVPGVSCAGRARCRSPDAPGVVYVVHDSTVERRAVKLGAISARPRHGALGLESRRAASRSAISPRLKDGVDGIRVEV